MDIRALLLGRPLANTEAWQEKLGVAAGIPAMGLDGLSSAAYGPEAALTVLMPLGALGVPLLRPVMLAILLLLGILYLSYLQTIKAYPVNGGSYTVAKENLGVTAGLLAATALMLDYVLNVAVGISAGVGALISAVPALQPWTLSLCLAALLLISLVNLRGTLEAGTVFSIPTYLFVGCFFAIIGVGLVKTVLAGGHPQPVAPLPSLPPPAAALGLWILLRAFASGCTAMTGVEAVSNGVSAFREPTVRHAQRTLTAMVAILAVLLAGVAHLTGAYGIAAMDQTQPGYQSVLSQLTMAVVGRNAFYYVAIGSVLAMLSLSANTSFVGFPRLCGLVAQDDFLPRAFAHVGHRLVNSVGVLFLAAFAGLLLVVFDGVTDRLIPLFAVGAFLSFTLSQAGMAWHWHRQLEHSAGPRERLGVRLRMIVNGFGAAATGGTLLIIVAAKFVEGAWISVLVIPLTVLLLKAIKHEYEREERTLRCPGPLDLAPNDPPVVIIATENWNRLTDKAIHFALRLSRDVTAVHLTQLGGPDADEHEQQLRQQWAEDVEQPARAAGFPPPRLVLLRSPYRQFIEPFLKLVDGIQSHTADRGIAVLIPELVKRHWWEHLLHTHRARRLRSALLRHHGPSLVVISVPWYLGEPQLGAARAGRGDIGAAKPNRSARLAKGVGVR